MSALSARSKLLTSSSTAAASSGVGISEDTPVLGWLDVVRAVRFASAGTYMLSGWPQAVWRDELELWGMTIW